jgi:lipid-binding SYLF domain-containing protein
MTVVGAFLLCLAGMAHADNPPTDKYAETIALFKHAGKGNQFFRRSYAYAVFPTVGEAGFIVGAALGTGRVYVHDRPVGESEMIQVSGGFQAGAKAFSQMIFFEDKRALDEFESGSFEFKAGVSAVVVTAGAEASAGTTGLDAGASGGEKDARTADLGYQKGVAVFVIVKGGLMYTATVAGQKFSYKPLDKAS